MREEVEEREGRVGEGERERKREAGQRGGTRPRMPVDPLTVYHCIDTSHAAGPLPVHLKNEKKTGGTLVGSDVTLGQNPPSNRFATIYTIEFSLYVCASMGSVCDRHLPTVYINTYRTVAGIRNV